jgi:hypothetical protein
MKNKRIRRRGVEKQEEEKDQKKSQKGGTTAQGMTNMKCELNLLKPSGNFTYDQV